MGNICFVLDFRPVLFFIINIFITNKIVRDLNLKEILTGHKGAETPEYTRERKTKTKQCANLSSPCFACWLEPTSSDSTTIPVTSSSSTRARKNYDFSPSASSSTALARCRVREENSKLSFQIGKWQGECGMNMSRVQSQEDEFRNNIFNFASYNEPAKAKWSIVSKANAEWTKWLLISRNPPESTQMPNVNIILYSFAHYRHQ